jgi:tetratricopeptide (TPR) repeat protein
MVTINICRFLISILIFCNGESSYELFSIGCQLELEGKIDQAIEYYYRAKALNPESDEIYLSLANALYKIGKFNEGINIAQEGLYRSPKNVQLYHTIAIGYIGKRELKPAISFYMKSLKIAPECIEIYNSLSILYEGIGNLKNAQQILLTMPDSLKSSETFARLGTLAGKLNDHEAAIAYFRQGYNLDTTSVTALLGVGTGFDLLNVKDSAIYYYEKTLREDTLVLTVGKRLLDLYSDVEKYDKLIKVAEKILLLDYNDGYVRRSLGYALYKLGMLQASLGEFLLASRLDQSDTYSKFYVGRIYLENGDYDAALDEIKGAIKINPDFIELWIYLGFIAIDKKDYETAEYAFNEAAHRGGDMTQIYYLFGVTAEMQQNHSDAYFYYHKSLKLNPKGLSALEALANLCERIEKKEEAFQTFKKIITVDTANAVALNYVGYTYADRNDSLEHALELINQAIAIEENNGYYLDSRGWVFYRMGKYEEALEELKKAASIVEDVVILEHLGDVYIKLDDPINAAKAYLKALKHDPENKVLKEKLKKIISE